MKIRSYSILAIISCMHIALTAHVIQITSLGQLASLVQTHDQVILKFYSNDCPPCRGFAPIYKQISDEPPFTSILFVEVNTQTCKDIARHYNVQSIPMVIFINNQQIVGIQTGSKNALQFKSLIKNYFSL